MCQHEEKTVKYEEQEGLPAVTCFLMARLTSKDLEGLPL